MLTAENGCVSNGAVYYMDTFVTLENLKSYS